MSEDQVQVFSTGDTGVSTFSAKEWQARADREQEEFEKELAETWRAEIREAMAGEEFEVQVLPWSHEFTSTPEVVGWTPTAVIVAQADQDLYFRVYAYRFPRNPENADG